MIFETKPIGIHHNTYDSGIAILKIHEGGESLTFARFFGETVCSPVKVEIETLPCEWTGTDEAAFRDDYNIYFLNEFVNFS